MNARHLKLIAFGVGALLLVWVASALLPSGTDRPRSDFRLPAIAADSVDSVTVRARAETLVIARTEAGKGPWTINGFAASSAAVAELFAALHDTARPAVELVARSGASFGRLGVDSSAARVSVWAANRPVLDLLVSERSPDAGGAYVRIPSDSAVYAWPGQLAAVVRRGADDWRDKVVATLTPDSVRRVVVERGARRYTLERRDDQWALSGGRRADSAAVTRFLERFRTVTAYGFPTRAQLDSAFAGKGRGRPERRVALFGPGGAALVTLEFDSIPGAFWVRRGRGETIYRMGFWDVDQLTPADSTLRN